jgi:hypothetical protein
MVTPAHQATVVAKAAGHHGWGKNPVWKETLMSTPVGKNISPTQKPTKKLCFVNEGMYFQEY